MRRPRNRDRRFGEVMIGLFLLIGGISAIGGDSLITLVLIVGGLYLLARQFDQSSGTRSTQRQCRLAKPTPKATRKTTRRSRTRRSRHSRAPIRSTRTRSTPCVKPDSTPTETHVLPTDVGVMAFTGDQEPAIYRTRDVPDDVDYIQPFVQLRLPTRAHGRIRFEIVDSDGQVLFVHEEDHEFQRGRNLITPAARLPIHDAHAMHGDWQLRVSADGMLIAEHDFGWQESASRVIRRTISEDGEINNEIRAMMTESRLQRLSLDELLAEQDADAEDESAPPRQQDQDGDSLSARPSKGRARIRAR